LAIAANELPADPQSATFPRENTPLSDAFSRLLMNRRPTGWPVELFMGSKMLGFYPFHDGKPLAL
jgi:hypothetical protein